MKDKFKITQAQFERFLALLEEHGVENAKMNIAQYAGWVVRCAVEAGWLEMNVDESDPAEVMRIHRAIQKRVEEILAPDPN